MYVLLPPPDIKGLTIQSAYFFLVEEDGGGSGNFSQKNEWGTLNRDQ